MPCLTAGSWQRHNELIWLGVDQFEAPRFANALFWCCEKDAARRAEICRVKPRVLRECRTARRSASISLQAAPLR